MNGAADSFAEFLAATGSTWIQDDARAHRAAVEPLERALAQVSNTITATRWTCPYCHARVSDFRDKCNCCGAFRT